MGTETYQHSSSLCKAAIHDGKIDGDTGGEILIKLVKH
ncbi:MAG: LCCL domain-containing protein [bacterium]